MQISKANQSSTSVSQDTTAITYAERLRVIAYSMDTLIPGIYVWLQPWTWRLGGCVPDN